jgi:(p)ppGpp synthase/HD superfamily hydrolase
MRCLATSAGTLAPEALDRHDRYDRQWESQRYSPILLHARQSMTMRSARALAARVVPLAARSKAQHRKEATLATVEDAIIVATEAHRGQQDKAGRSFILHPLSVMLMTETDEQRQVAALHDVVEDTPVTLDDLRRHGFSEPVLAAIDRLTRREGEDYEAFVRRAAEDRLARVVKMADLRDNLATTRRLPDSPEAHERIGRYQRALAYLTSLAS